MMNYDDYRQRREERRQRREERILRHREKMHEYGFVWSSRDTRRGHIWTGLFMLLIGVAALIKITVIGLPYWLFSWQMVLIGLGLFIGLRHNFRGSTWFALMLVGGAFLLNEIYPDIAIRRYIWPVALIVIGIFLIIRPRHRRCNPDEEPAKPAGTGTVPGTDPGTSGSTNYSDENFIDSTCIFSGTKKNIISKDFKGGDIVNIFGGAEINLSQADFTGRIPMEFTNIFGGTKLIIPANWSVQSEAVTIFGGLEDKRPVTNVPPSPDKVLVLSGTIIFGGIEIKSY